MTDAPASSRLPARAGADAARRPRPLAGEPGGDGLAALVMILPAAILFALFFHLALRAAASGCQPDRLGRLLAAGLHRRRQLLSASPATASFLGALDNNLIFVVATLVLKNVLGLALALLLDRALAGRAFFRAASFVPVTMSFVAAGLLWSWIYNPVFGLLNAALDLVGLGFLRHSWLGDANTALYAIIAVDVWKWLGFHGVIYLAGLQTIPADLYESATMDGAGRVRRFWHVTLPLMMPIVFINSILGLSGAFVRNFDIVHVLTEGGPEPRHRGGADAA